MRRTTTDKPEPAVDEVRFLLASLIDGDLYSNQAQRFAAFKSAVRPAAGGALADVKPAIDKRIADEVVVRKADGSKRSPSGRPR